MFVLDYHTKQTNNSSTKAIANKPKLFITKFSKPLSIEQKHKNIPN